VTVMITRLDIHSSVFQSMNQSINFWSGLSSDATARTTMLQLRNVTQ